MKPVIIFKIIILLFIMLSCNNERLEMYNELLDVINVKDETKYLLILDQSGCSTCLYKADEFYFQNSNRKDVMYLFTGFVSQKHIKLKYKILNDAPNVYIDIDNIINKYNLKIDYPALLEVRKGKVQSVIIMKPDNFKEYSNL